MESPLFRAHILKPLWPRYERLPCALRTYTPIVKNTCCLFFFYINRALKKKYLGRLNCKTDGI